MTVKETFSRLDGIISGKRILCVPIVSSINRMTDKYKLDCDGNINRIVTAFSHANSFKELTIFLPIDYESKDILDYFVKKNKNKINLIYTPYFGRHAGEQRSKPECFEKTLELIENEYIDNYDYIFVESQYLGNALISNGYRDKLIFWNNVCEIEVDGYIKSRNFMQGYNNLNRNLVRNCAYTICVSPETTDYWKTFMLDEGNSETRILNCPYLIDRDLSYFNYHVDTELKEYVNSVKASGYEIIYLPYRLTDEGYQMDKVIKFINDYCITHKVAVFYSDPNDSHYLEQVKTKLNKDIKYVKVSTDRGIYYTLLDCTNVIIPYFEDIAFVNHASIHEMFNHQADCIVVLDISQTLDKLKDYGDIPVDRIGWY